LRGCGWRWRGISRCASHCIGCSEIVALLFIATAGFPLTVAALLLFLLVVIVVLVVVVIVPAALAVLPVVIITITLLPNVNVLCVAVVHTNDINLCHRGRPPGRQHPRCR